MGRKLRTDDIEMQQHDLKSLTRVRNRQSGCQKLPKAVRERCSRRLLEVYRDLEDHGYGCPVARRKGA